jgi:hypothetical protein
VEWSATDSWTGVSVQLKASYLIGLGSAHFHYYTQKYESVISKSTQVGSVTKISIATCEIPKKAIDSQSSSGTEERG